MAEPNIIARCALCMVVIEQPLSAFMAELQQSAQRARDESKTTLFLQCDRCATKKENLDVNP